MKGSKIVLGEDWLYQKSPSIKLRYYMINFLKFPLGVGSLYPPWWMLFIIVSADLGNFVLIYYKKHKPYSDGFAQNLMSQITNW